MELGRTTQNEEFTGLPGIQPSPQEKGDKELESFALHTHGIPIKKVYSSFNLFLQALYMGMYSFLFFYIPNELLGFFELSPLVLQIAGGVFGALAVFELLAVVLSAIEMIKAFQNKPHAGREKLLGFSNMASLLASLSMAIGSGLFFLNTFFPTAVEFISVGMGLSSTVLMATFPYFIMIGMALLAVNSLLHALAYDHEGGSHYHSLSNASRFLVVSPSFAKAFAYSALAICMGLGIIGLVTPGICMIVSVAACVCLMGLTLMEQYQTKKKLMLTSSSKTSKQEDVSIFSTIMNRPIPAPVFNPSNPKTTLDLHDSNNDQRWTCYVQNNHLFLPAGFNPAVNKTYFTDRLPNQTMLSLKNTGNGYEISETSTRTIASLPESPSAVTPAAQMATQRQRDGILQSAPAGNSPQQKPSTVIPLNNVHKLPSPESAPAAVTASTPSTGAPPSSFTVSFHN